LKRPCPTRLAVHHGMRVCEPTLRCKLAVLLLAAHAECAPEEASKNAFEQQQLKLAWRFHSQHRKRTASVQWQPTTAAISSEMQHGAEPWQQFVCCVTMQLLSMLKLLSSSNAGAAPISRDSNSTSGTTVASTSEPMSQVPHACAVLLCGLCQPWTQRATFASHAGSVR